MKIAFVSDTHFGYPRYEADASAQGRAAVLEACARADVLVLGGDIFDHRVPKLETLGEVAMLLQEAQKILIAKWQKKPNGTDTSALDGQSPVIPPLVLAIHGTHERRAKDALNPIAMMARLGLLTDLHNQTVVLERRGGENGLVGADDPRIDRVAFSGLGGIPDDLVKEALSRLSCKPAEGAVNFFVFHQTMHEFVPAAPGLASVEDLPLGYDWYLCGHIHARAEFMGGKLLLPGSTVMTQMKDEESRPKGYYLIDTSALEEGERTDAEEESPRGRAMLGRAEFISIRTRPFEVSELVFEKAAPADVRGQVEEEIRHLVSKKWEADPILKIRLKGSLTTGAGELDLSRLTEGHAAFVFIDNQLDGGNLASELEKLKADRLHRSTPHELGRSLLRENAQAAGLDAQKAESYFEEFSKEE
jgi:DNA repair exonuclease SbcCD nuclease subunit